MNDSDRNKLILGDIHGEFDIIFKYLRRGILDDSDLYQIGDFGIGFETEEKDLNNLSLINDDLEKHNTKLFVIRGNHDDPSYWLDYDKRTNINKQFSNIEFIEDYTYKTINGVSVLFIGGAVSIDRVPRMEEYDKTGNESWWEAERLSPPDQLEEADIIISHTCPSFFNMTTDPVSLKWWIKYDEDLLEDLKYERSLMDAIFNKVKPKRFYSGHFHNRMKGNLHGCEYKCVDINALMEIDTSIDN